MICIEELKFDQKGLIPAIIQDINNKRVLMLGYMNKKSVELTLETKKTWFYSRSREKLWNKGETSGNYHIVKNIAYDCDRDTLLVQVVPQGPTCHTGTASCFSQSIYEEDHEEPTNEIYELLYKRIKKRKEEDKSGSYTKYLFEEGLDKILKKIGEESSEVIIAAKNEDKNEIICEISDLIYHTIVLMVEKNIDLCDIEDELLKRYKGKK